MMKAEWVGVEEFRAAIERNPKVALSAAKSYLTRGMAQYKRGIINSPWAVGSGGGGSPVATGNLRDTHATEVSSLTASIYPTAPYAGYVHGGTARMKARPWLDYVRDDKAPEIERLQDEMLETITENLAK